MIERYTLPEIGAVWTEEAKYRAWLEVELAVCRARAELGEIPTEEVEELAEKANFTVERIHEIERDQSRRNSVRDQRRRVRRDVARHFHFGLTSSDVLDTAGALQLRRPSISSSTGGELTLLLAGDGVGTSRHRDGRAYARGSRRADGAGAQARRVGFRDGAEPGPALSRA